MKKYLLFTSALFMGFSAQAQFVESNAPAVGDQLTLYVIDSLAPNYADVQGEGVTWDYSSYQGTDDQEVRIVSALNAPDTTNNGVFSTSEIALDIQDFFVSYMTNTPTGRMGQGFIFEATELGVGKVVAKYEESSPETLFSYPFDLNDQAMSTFEGVVTLNLGQEVDLPLVGNAVTSIDGKGTLKLAGNDYTDVSRYSLIDTMVVSLSESDPNMTVLIVRQQYEYYDHSISNLPLFIHTLVTFAEQMEGGAEGVVGIVLSYENPATAGIEKNELANAVVYPNPASDILSIQLPSAIDKAAIVITDALGRKVHTASISKGENSIQVSDLKQGVYFVTLTSQNISTTKTIVIK